MPKKPTLQQRNAAKAELLLKQKVSSSKGFLKQEFKKFIVEEMVFAANRQKKSIKGTESVQERYDRFKILYDKLFFAGLSGHGMFPQQIERQYKRDKAKGIDYYIREQGKEKKVGLNELAYKMEFLSHQLATKYDVAYTKFKPIHYLVGKGNYRIVIEIPSLTKDVRELGYDDLDEMDTDEVFEFFEEHHVEIIVSDPSKRKGKKAKAEYEEGKARRIKSIAAAKKKHYKQWKKGKKPTITKKTKPSISKAKRSIASKKPLKNPIKKALPKKRKRK